MIPDTLLQYGLEIAILAVSAFNAYTTLKVRLLLQEAKTELRSEMAQLELRIEKRVSGIETRIAVEAAQRRKWESSQDAGG